MTNKELIRVLERTAPDNHRCFGCGYEHHCGIHGCAVNRAAAAVIKEQEKQIEEAESRINKAFAIANNAIYFADSADYRSALCDCGVALVPEVAVYDVGREFVDERGPQGAGEGGG